MILYATALRVLAPAGTLVVAVAAHNILAKTLYGDPPEERVEPFERARVPVGSPNEARRVIDSLATLELDHEGDHGLGSDRDVRDLTQRRGGPQP